MPTPLAVRNDGFNKHPRFEILTVLSDSSCRHFVNSKKVCRGTPFSGGYLPCYFDMSRQSHTVSHRTPLCSYILPYNPPSSFQLRSATPIHLRPGISIQLPLLLRAFFYRMSLFQRWRRRHFITPVDRSFLILLGTSLEEKKEAEQEYYTQARDGGCDTDSGFAASTESAGRGVYCSSRW